MLTLKCTYKMTWLDCFKLVRKLSLFSTEKSQRCFDDICNIN